MQGCVRMGGTGSGGRGSGSKELSSGVRDKLHPVVCDQRERSSVRNYCLIPGEL